MSRVVLLVLAGLLAFGGLTACHAPQAPDALPVKNFENFPSPAGFAMRQDISRTEEAARFMRLFYEAQGSYGYERVADFYYVELTNRGWEFADDSQLPDERVWRARFTRNQDGSTDVLTLEYHERKAPNTEAGRISVLKLSMN